MYTDNALLFPRHVIPALRDLNGNAWRNLVNSVTGLDDHDERLLAFMLMMIRLDGCMVCETDSYRAMRGCTACAQQTLRRFKGTEQDLLNRYQDALSDIHLFAQQNPTLAILEKQV